MIGLRQCVIGVQGWWLRRTMEVLPPASDPTSGRVGGIGAVEPLRVAVLGESTAAGCGVATHDEGFAGCFARNLSSSTGRPVCWDVVGRHGATARRIRYRLLPRLDAQYDLVVVLAGANDVLSRRTAEEWREDLTAILDGLTRRARFVVVAGVPPFATFPSLPRALRRYLAERGEALDHVSRLVCAGRANARWSGSAGVGGVGPAFFARDGFHPSGYGYRRWAEIVTESLPALER